MSLLASITPLNSLCEPSGTRSTTTVSLLQGLDYLHYNKVVHGDLKPDNLLMSAAGRVKITDFGSSHMFQRGDTMLRTMGTPAFMAPEMCVGGNFHGRTCDIWALGICLYMFHYGRLAVGPAQDLSSRHLLL